MRVSAVRHIVLAGWFDPSIVRGDGRPQGPFASVFQPCPSDCSGPYSLRGDDPERAEAMERWFVPGVGRGPLPRYNYFHGHGGDGAVPFWDPRPRRMAEDFCYGSCLRAVSSRFSHFPWRIFSSWKPAVSPGVVRGAQWDVGLTANVFPYGGGVVWFSLAGHFPGGADPGALGEELTRLDPRYGREACLTHDGRPWSAKELVDEFGRRLVGGLLPSADFDLDPADCYSVTLLTNVEGRLDPQRDFGPLAGLSRGVGNWEGLAPDILDSYKETDYGLFRDDVCFVRRRGTLAYLPEYDRPTGPRARRTKRVLLWLVRPAELALVQGMVARSYTEDFLTLGARLTRARLDSKAKIRNFFKLSFLQVGPLLFLRDLAAFHDDLPPGARKLYYRIAAAGGAERDMSSLRALVAEVVEESERWRAPVLSVVGPALSVGRKLGGL